VLRRRRPVPPPRDVYPVPRQLDRNDFRRVETPWLVALFSSTACDSCDGLMAKLAVLESADVATCEIEYHDQPDLHDRYEIAGIRSVREAVGGGGPAVRAVVLAERVAPGQLLGFDLRAVRLRLLAGPAGLVPHGLVDEAFRLAAVEQLLHEHRAGDGLEPG